MLFSLIFHSSYALTFLVVSSIRSFCFMSINYHFGKVYTCDALKLRPWLFPDVAKGGTQGSRLDGVPHLSRLPLPHTRRLCLREASFISDRACLQDSRDTSQILKYLIGSSYICFQIVPCAASCFLPLK